MALFKQAKDLTLIGMQVTTFPNGIKESFDILMETLGNDHAHYGISWMDENDNVIYYAMASEAFPGEGKQYDYQSLTIEKGEYKTETIHDWLSKTDSVKEVFDSLMADNKPDKNHPCIEWYISDEEMLCMVRSV